MVEVEFLGKNMEFKENPKKQPIVVKKGERTPDQKEVSSHSFVNILNFFFLIITLDLYFTLLFH